MNPAIREASAMKFVKPLSDENIQALTEAYTYADQPGLRRRAHAILLSHKGYPINQISDILTIHRETVSLWLSKWDQDALSGLQDEARSGRPPILDARDR